MSSTPSAPQQSVFQFAKDGHFDYLLHCVETSPGLLERFSSDDGESLLHWAAFHGHEGFVRKALSSSLIRPDMLSKSGQTALMWSCYNDHVAIARMLLDAGASLQAKDVDGATPSIFCMCNNAMAVFLLFMQRSSHGVLQDIDIRGCGLIHYASFSGNRSLLQLLKYFGADMFAQDSRGMTALHMAVSSGEDTKEKLQVCKYLIEFLGMDPLLQTKDCTTCYDMVKSNGELEAGMRRAAKRVRRKKSSAAIDEESGRWSATSQASSLADTKVLLPIALMTCAAFGMLSWFLEVSSQSWTHAPCASLAFAVSSPLCVALFVWTALSDPGTLTPRAYGQSGVEELMKVFGSGDPADVDVSRLCTQTFIIKGPRDKYCKSFGLCVEEVDHDCIWLNNTIACGNRRRFVLLVMLEPLVEIMHISSCRSVFQLIEDDGNGWFQRSLDIFWKYPATSFSMGCHIVVLPCIFLFTIAYLWLIARNFTLIEVLHIRDLDTFWKAQSESHEVQQEKLRREKNSGWLDASVEVWMHQCQELPTWMCCWFAFMDLVWANHIAYLKSIDRNEEEIHNPFDRGSAWENCWHFWFADYR